MNDLKERIMTNIRAEVRNFLRRDTPLPKRDERWEDITAKLLVEERELLEKEREAKHMADYESLSKNLERAYNTAGNGMPYEEWLDECKKRYIINGTTVISLARGTDKEQEWKLKSPWQAKKKVLQLIYWMYYEHFLRAEGLVKDFMCDPDEE